MNVLHKKQNTSYNVVNNVVTVSLPNCYLFNSLQFYTLQNQCNISGYNKQRLVSTNLCRYFIFYLFFGGGNLWPDWNACVGRIEFITVQKNKFRPPDIFHRRAFFIGPNSVTWHSLKSSMRHRSRIVKCLTYSYTTWLLHSTSDDFYIMAYEYSIV